MTASEVKLLHFRIGFDLLRQAFLEDATVVHHRHAFDDAQCDVHVVLDDDVADMGGQGGQDFDQLAPLGWRQPGCRLVEQNETRRPRQCQRDFELTLLSMRELRHALLLDRGQMHRLDQEIGRMHQRVVGARPQRREPSTGNATAGEIDVVLYRQAGKQR